MMTRLLPIAFQLVKIQDNKRVIFHSITSYYGNNYIIGASMSESHIDQLNGKNSVCMYVCIYLCMFVSLTQISLTPIATLYDNGFSGRVQNSSRAFNPRGELASTSGSLRDRESETAESQVKAASALRHDVATSIAKT